MSERTKLRRLPNRGSHETEQVNAILDAAYLAHVGFSVDGQPFVIPTLFGREGEKLYLHGSAASRMMRTLEAGVPACVTVTLVDRLVLALSASPFDELPLSGDLWNGAEDRKRRG